MTKKFNLKALAITAAVAVPLLACGVADANRSGRDHDCCKKPAGKYIAGDFHQHSLYTDGSYPFMKMMEEDNSYGLGWWANSEHGGARNRDGEGVSWLNTDKYPVNPILGDNPEAGYMYRWQGLRDFVFPDILTTRALYPDKTVINGLEWNVPGHEHCSTAIYQFDNTANAISEFEFRFDRSDHDTSRTGEGSLVTGFGPLDKINSTKEDAIEGVRFMQAVLDQGIGVTWVVPAHIERASSYTVADFRNWNNAGPDVAFGYEGAPGHQTSGDRGFGRNADGGGTYGGSGWYSAEIGGLWDALLGEGRNWWNFASSDCHKHWSDGGSDFWPGEYQKNYTFIDTCMRDHLKAVFEGVRSGNSYHVEGDLIDKLQFTAKSNQREATMGQTLKVQEGDMVTIKIKVHDPQGANFCPLDMDNPSLAQIGVSQPLSKPVLDHVDVIGGEYGDRIDPIDEEAYNNATNPTAAVVKTCERHGGWNKNGWLTCEYKFRAEAGKNMYFRLRGTNLPADVPFETDINGNPLADSEANDNIYQGDVAAGKGLDDAVLETMLLPGIEVNTNGKLAEVAEAYADLWFYSNPIFVEVVERHHKHCRR